MFILGFIVGFRFVWFWLGLCYVLSLFFLFIFAGGLATGVLTAFSSLGSLATQTGGKEEQRARRWKGSKRNQGV